MPLAHLTYRTSRYYVIHWIFTAAHELDYLSLHQDEYQRVSR